MLIRPLLCLVAVLALFLRLGVSSAPAHPVAQGVMEIIVRPDRIDVYARVSNEQAFVAEAFGENKDADTTLDAVWRRHGEYLIEHLQLTVDGVSVPGRVAGMTPPEKNTAESRVSYDLQFPLPAERAHPRAVEFRQNVLNEIMFAPGTPWEASYVVRISQKGHVVQDGVLWTSRQPLTFTCDWSLQPEAASATAITSLNPNQPTGTLIRHGLARAFGSNKLLLLVAGLAFAVTSVWICSKLRRSRSLTRAR